MSHTRQINEFSCTPEFVCGDSPAIQPVNSLVAEIACTNIPVLLTGESGTGKDAYARFIHRLSAGPPKLLKKVNCATLDEESFKEHILDSARSGQKNAEYSSGTLFLDQIDDLDSRCQRALLPLLPDGEAGSGEPKLSARLISAASRDLKQEVESGRFRRELFFRINGVSLRLPPLRERKEEIPALLDCFLTEYSAQLQRPRPEVNGETMETLLSHMWPGNIRELQNLAKMMVVLGRTHLVLTELSSTPTTGLPPHGTTEVSSLKIAARAASRQTERALILRTLERTRWNRKRAAQELQISYKSLLYKLKQIAIPGTESREEF